MKRRLLFLAFGILIQQSFAQNQNEKQLVKNIDKLMTERFDPEGPGATILVARDNQVLIKKAYGKANLELDVPMQVDNVFRIGSITKQFTAISILQLMEQGKLNLNDEITTFLPDYPTQGFKITIENLLTHTSGIPSFTGMDDYYERMTLDLEPTEIIDHFKNEPLNFAPGTDWEYSNSGYFLLGYIIEKVSGKTYPEYLDEYIFKPLGMNNSLYGSNSKIIKNRVGTYSMDEKGIVNADPISMTQPYSAGSIQSTVEDLYKWHQGIQSYKLIKKETLDKALSRHKLDNGKETKYGYGWFLRYIGESPTIEHGGGINGSLTTSIFLPKENVFVTIFSNCECNHPEELAIKTVLLLIGKKIEYQEIRIENSVLDSYDGVYENEKGEMRNITVTDNILYSQRGRGPKFQLKAYENDKFFFDDALTTIEFIRSGNGETEKLIFIGRDGSEEWVKTDKTFETITEIEVDSIILAKYVGEYEISHDFKFNVTLEENHLFIQATGQEKVQIFAETETKFFLKVNDAQLEFLSDDTGSITEAILQQGGRKTMAPKIN